MITLRTGLATAGAAVLATGLTIAATQGSSHAATAVPAEPPVVGGATLHQQQTNLPNGVWVNTLSVRLPRAGTYEIDANVRGRIAASAPINTYITARLWNGETGAPIRYSERLVYQTISFVANSGSLGGNNTAPIDEWVTVYGPTTITLQAVDIYASGTPSIAQIYSDTDGYTTLRWTRVS
jgi:hypothetical protein